MVNVSTPNIYRTWSVLRYAFYIRQLCFPALGMTISSFKFQSSLSNPADRVGWSPFCRNCVPTKNLLSEEISVGNWKPRPNPLHLKLRTRKQRLLPKEILLLHFQMSEHVGKLSRGKSTPTAYRRLIIIFFVFYHTVK